MCSLEYAFTLSCRCEWKQVLWVVNSSWEIQNWESYWRWQFCSRQRVHGQVREDNRLFTDAYISALEFILTWMNRRPLKDSALGASGFTRSQAAWLQPARLLCPWDSQQEYWSEFMPFSRGSSWPSDQTCISLIAGRFFTVWATREALPHSINQILPRISNEPLEVIF